MDSMIIPTVTRRSQIVGSWSPNCRATGRALSASCAWWRFLRLRQHTGARYGSRPRQRREQVSADLPTNKTTGAGCGDPLPPLPLSVCQQLRQRRATPPRLAGRSRQTAALAAAAFAAASPSLSIWGGVGVPVPQLAAVCAGARGAPALHAHPEDSTPCARRGFSARQRTPQGRPGAAAVGEPQQRRTTAGGSAPPAPTEPSGSLLQRSLPRQQQQDGGGAATAGCPRT